MASISSPAPPAARPTSTCVVIRRPGDDADYSGLVLAESMHSSGAARAFECGGAITSVTAARSIFADSALPS